MGDRHRRAAIAAGTATALLVLTTAPAATDEPMAVTAPGATSTPTGTPVAVPGAAITGLDAAEVVRVLVSVGSGTLSVPGSATDVVVPAGYPTLGAEGPALAIEGTQDALNAALAGLRWTPAGDGSTEISVDASPAGAAFDADSGHFYQVVDPGQVLDWADARTAAALVSFAGQAGYLASVTGPEEQGVLRTITPDVAWMAGHRQSGSRWEWVDGPDAGQTFWTPECGSGLQGPCSANGSNTFAWWAPSEPRRDASANATVMLGGEDGEGLWVAVEDDEELPSYAIEFGGTPGDQAVETAHAETTVAAFGPGISPILPSPIARPIRIPPSTVPTTPPTTVPPPPETTVPVTTSPPRTTPTTVPATVPTPAPVVTTVPVADTTTPATSTAPVPDPGTTIVPMVAAGARPSDGVPVYVVFDVGVGTPIDEARATVRASQLTPGSSLTGTVDGTSIGTIPVGSDGVAVGEVTLDVVPDGEHTLVVTATAADGSPLERQLPFTVTDGQLSRIGAAPPAASTTTTATTATATATTIPVAEEDVVEEESSGSGLPVPLIVALLAAVAGAIVWLVSRRRKGGPAGGGGEAAPAPPDRVGAAAPLPFDERIDSYR